MNHFTVKHEDCGSKARVGRLQTDRGIINTPVFMPVGTQATVKTMKPSDLEEAGAQIILANAYHLYLRPGDQLIQELGGLHEFMNWDRPILTDSGGFQIFSLNEKKKLTAEGLQFKSHIDGSSHFLSPEDVVDIENRLGVDILMPLDECVAYPADEKQCSKSVDLTHNWLARSKDRWVSNGKRGMLFGIIQGGVWEKERIRSARISSDLDLPGYAIGGLSVGEPQAEMLRVLEPTIAHMPKEKPRYLMGVGYPDDLILAVEQGVDMFDCVVPTRNGRNGTVFYSGGKLLLRNREFLKDTRPIDEKCNCYTCKNFSRAYLRHLFIAKEMLGLHLASLHNITFFIQLLDKIRNSIADGCFGRFKSDFFSQYQV